MEQISRLGDIPSEIGVKPNQTNIQVDYECIGSLNDSNQLQIYSLVHKKVIQIIPDVQNYIFVKTAISDKSMLVTSNETTIKLYSFSDYYPPDSLEFNPKNKVAPFFDNIKTDHLFAQLCEFETEFKIVKLIPSDFNTILLLDEQSNLRRYNFYLDGVYNAGKFDSFSCIQFAFSGLYLAGLSSTEVHFWSANLEHLSSIQFQGSTICSLSTSLFAVCNGEEINVFDATNGSKTKTIQAINPTVNPTFVSFYGEDSAICTPEGTVIARKSHFLPIFVSGSGLYTINEEKYFLRLINVFPITVALSMIQSQKNNNTSNHSIAQYAVKLQDANLVESYLNSSDPQNTLQFLEDLTDILKNTSNITFALSINSIVTTYCIQKISSTIYPDQFSNSLCNFRNLLYPRLPIDAPPQETQQQIPIKKIRDAELLSYVLDNLEKNTITTSLPSLQNSYHDFEPFYLFRTLVLQQSWSKICQNNINESIKLIEQLGENPLDHLYEMWRQTTRNKTRSYLYEYLNKNGRLNELDEKHHQILLKITQKYPTTSFKVAQKLSSSPGVRVIDDNKLPAWQPIIDLNSDFDEKKAMIFPSLFKIPDEPIIESPRYFLGNIALIEAQPENIIKMLTNEGSSIEKLWILHCEHRVNDMAQFFKNEIDKNKGNNTTKLKCLKFINKYHSQMNTYELETLLDILCQSGIFAQHELEDFELLLVRICKNKFLFDQQWWSQSTLNLTTFFKQFASFCAKKSLFMPFEMFVISHPNTKEIDISDINEPLIKFIWDLWVKRDPANATLSCMQFIAKSNSTDLVELWKHLPNDSLAPLGSFVWNKDPEKFKPNSPETEALSNRLKNEYPLLSSLVKGIIPHPQTINKEPPSSRWRSPIYTSKYDLELHDLIQSHFSEYDFSKVFTDYYGKTPGQPPFPHFDHPELITSPSEPPYVYYVKSMLPVSAFQQAIEDNINEEQFKELCIQCIKEAFLDKEIRLAVLSFIELIDLKFNKDTAIDYKMIISIFDILNKPEIQNEVNQLIDDLIQLYSNKNQEIAINIKKKLAPTEIELFLLTTLIDVRCNLPLDYTPIINFASYSRTAELLLFIDRAAELGANYPINEVVKIVQEKMPKDYPLKAHLLFHLTQSLPTEEGPSSSDLPALVVYRAVRRTDQSPQTSLLQEALNRKVQLYSLLATSIEGSDILLCAYVTMLTMTDVPISFDVKNPPEHNQMITLFFQTLYKLLLENKSLELMQTLELFSETSIVIKLIHFYRAIELFAFRRAENELPQINNILNKKDKIIDELMGEITIEEIINIFQLMINSLSKKCNEKSQIHVFRFLQVLEDVEIPLNITSRIKLCKVISKFDNFRRAIIHCDLLGEPEQIISKLVLNHSLELGQEAAKCLNISSTSAIYQWLEFKYSTASTPTQILEIHQEVIKSIKEEDINPMFFLYLFSSLIPYCQPITLLPIIEYIKDIMNDKDTKLYKNILALITYLNVCKENHIEIPQVSNIINLPTLKDILKILFPEIEFENVPESIKLSISTPIIINLENLQRFFEISIDQAIDICLDKHKASDAHLICAWRNRDPHNIQLLEIIQKIILNNQLTEEEMKLITKFGNVNDIESLLDNLSLQNGWRFTLISLHYKAAKILGLQNINPIHSKTSEFIESKLSVTYKYWPLIKELIQNSKMSIEESSYSLAKAYFNHINDILTNNKSQEEDTLQINDYSDKFIEFMKLNDSPTLISEQLFEIAKKEQKNISLNIIINLLLHSSICMSDIDECSEFLDVLLESLASSNEYSLIIDIISIFPDPSLIPRYFQLLISQNKLDLLTNINLNDKVGKVIMNCARHEHMFQPEKYFDLTLKYNLYRDHAELQMEYGNNILNNNNEILNREKLQEASRHFLLALAYFLHEKCYSLSMECLKKLSLISLQLEIPEPIVFHLNKSQVLQMMCTKEFPFALTVAVAYDMDTEPNWAEALFAQSVKVKNDDFLTAFQYFRPITSNLCDGVVKKYKELQKVDENITERMKRFLDNQPNLVERYRIAKALNFKDLIENMRTRNPVVCEWCEKVLLNKQ